MVTNGLLIAAALADAPGITVLVTGGTLRLSSMSLVGEIGADALRTTRINKGFLGARGLSLERGLMDLNPEEVRIKQEMADACERVIGILDGTKWHRSALLSFVPAAQVHSIVTDSSAPTEEMDAWRAQGIGVHVVDLGSSEWPPVRPRDLRRVAPDRGRERLMTTMVAADLGAQSGRVALGRFDGERLEISEVHRFPNVPVRTRGTLSWDILRLYQDVLAGLRAAGSEAGHVDSVGIDAWAVDFGLLDRSGRLLANPTHYRDARRAAAVDGVFARIPPRELYERTGIQLLPINTVFELAGMATESDPTLAAADTLLMIPDLLHYWLCGSRVAERTNATTTQCFDPRADAWATDLLARLDIPARCSPRSFRPARRSVRSPPMSPTRFRSRVPRSSPSVRTTPPRRSPPSHSVTPARPTSAPARGRSSGSRWKLPSSTIAPSVRT